MKFIHKYKSLNFDSRRKDSEIYYIILHYTAMKSDIEALNHLCDTKNKVSSHFLINKIGKIYQLVDLKMRAWHAGKSFWGGEIDINSTSVGIEIDNSGYNLDFEEFPKTQIQSLMVLLSFLKKNFHIKDENILGHSDVSPYRKIDPGSKFPWHFLQKKEISYMPKTNKNKIYNNLNILLEKKSLNSIKKEILFMLSLIGFDISFAKKDHKYFLMLIKSYQLHYRASKTDGKLDVETINIIKSHANDLLTI